MAKPKAKKQAAVIEQRFNVLTGNIETVEPTIEHDAVDVKKPPSAFDLLNDIMYGKEYIGINQDDIYDDSGLKSYSPFFINKGLSQHVDTVLLAGLINKASVTDTRMHHDFLMATVPPAKRYGKWAKVEEPINDIDKTIAAHFKVSPLQAREYIKIMDKDEVKLICSYYADDSS